MTTSSLSWDIQHGKQSGRLAGTEVGIIDAYSLSQVTFDANDQLHDSLLFETVTPYVLPARERAQAGKGLTPTPPDKAPCVITFSAFPRFWQVLMPDQKQASKIHRPYWLGESWSTDSIKSDKQISDILVRDLAEKVRRFKANIDTAYLVPYDKSLVKVDPAQYKNGQDYRDYFASNKRNSRFDWDVVNKLANGEAIPPISAEAFGTFGDVLTEDEIEKIYLELKNNPEPKLVTRPASFEAELNGNREDLKGLKEGLSGLNEAVTQLVKAQVSQLKSNTKEK